LSERLKGQPGRLIPKKLDVSKEKEIEELFKLIEKELGGVDVLINNAAVLNMKPIHGKIDFLEFQENNLEAGIVPARNL